MTIFGYLMTMFAGIFWIFRLVIALFATIGKSFPIVPLNLSAEIAVLFISFICIVLTMKRKILWSIIYMLLYFAYFGVDLYKTIQNVIEEGTGINNIANLLISVIGVIIPLLIFTNIGLNSGRKSAGNNKQTDWFYKTNTHDRVYDERADKNQYKF